MAITVKKLIEALQNVDNQFAEVEIYAPRNYANHMEIDYVRKTGRKVLIFTKEVK